MAWKIGAVRTVNTGRNGSVGHTFAVQQEERSPALAFVFNDDKIARQAREIFKREILNKVAAIIPNSGSGWEGH